MADLKWNVEVTSSVRKGAKKLNPRVLDALKQLIIDLENGPEQPGWSNYSQIHKQSYHCHLKKGKPTYVAFWTADKKTRLIEVYYAGTHEKAPY